MAERSQALTRALQGALPLLDPMQLAMMYADAYRLAVRESLARHTRTRGQPLPRGIARRVKDQLYKASRLEDSVGFKQRHLTAGEYLR